MLQSWREKKEKLDFFHGIKESDPVIHLVAAVFCRSIVKLLVSFDTSSIFNVTEFDEELLLLLYFSGSLSRTDDGMMTDDFTESS